MNAVMGDRDFALRFSPQEEQQMTAANIDCRLTLETLRILKRQRATPAPVSDLEIPEIDNRQIVDCRDELRLYTKYDHSIVQLARYIPYQTLQLMLPHLQRCTTDGVIRWDRNLLEAVGKELYSICAYGVLNGGSATSYFDPIHNRRMNSALFEEWQVPFTRAREQYGTLPKALSPALYHADGSAGATFMELRVRYLLRNAIQNSGQGGAFFQMTSQGNHDAIVQATRQAFDTYDRLTKSAPPGGGEDRERERAAAASVNAQQHDPRLSGILCEAQPLLATFAYDGGAELSLERTPPLFYVSSTGGTGEGGVDEGGAPSVAIPYGLPGGHGQLFHVLRPLLQQLFTSGIRFIFLGNIDNLGYTMNPIGLAYLVLQDGEALFEAVPRSVVDIKGGVLARRVADGKLCNAELSGKGMDLETVVEHERDGKSVLFNCAIGLFNLERLLLKLDEYLARLPVHCIHKKTARGEYWQLEQIAWDIMELIDTPYILVHSKAERFLAAKLVSDTFLLSGLPIQTTTDYVEVATQLHATMKTLMADRYGMKYQEGRWLAEDM